MQLRINRTIVLKGNSGYQSETQAKSKRTIALAVLCHEIILYLPLKMAMASRTNPLSNRYRM